LPTPQPLQIDPKWIPAIGNLDEMQHYHVDADGVVRLRFSRAEKRVMRKRRKVKPSVWAPKHRHLPSDAAVAGPWRNSTVPYAPGILDAAAKRYVQEITLCATPQSAKTEIVYTFCGWTTDTAPGNWLIVFPSQTDSKDNASDRIIPMFKDSPRLRGYRTGFADDETGEKIQLKHMRIYMAWATSASRLANRPLPYVFLDEEDKYPPTVGRKEASPYDLARKRTVTFKHMRKIFRASSPNIESGPIWMALQAAHLVFDYHAVCPYCHKEQLMRFAQIKWTDGERDPKMLEATRDAWYECEHCGAHWDNGDRDRAVRAGQWRDREGNRPIEKALEAVRPLKIGFHIPSWISPFVELWEIAVAFLKGQKGQPNYLIALRDFNNGFAALPWRATQSDRAVQTILELCDDRPEGRVPGTGEVACLLAGVDTQDDGFWFEIRAVGFGLESWDSWGVRCGFVGGLEDLTKVLWEDQYEDVDGNAYPVRFALIDAMGHRTAEVYNFCMGHRGRILPSQGKDNQAAPIAYTTLESFPPDNRGRRRPIPGGLQLVKVDTNYFKNLLDGMLKIAPGDPGAWLYHADLRIDWARHMVAEGINERGVWEPITANRPNHGWDCSVLIMAARELLGVKFWPRPEPAKKSKQRADDTDRRSWRDNKDFERPSWLHAR
jgi:phage terminase large subunit GpA-like protein